MTVEEEKGEMKAEEGWQKMREERREKKKRA